jgi:hypothetical protein
LFRIHLQTACAHSRTPKANLKHERFSGLAEVTPTKRGPGLLSQSRAHKSAANQLGLGTILKLLFTAIDPAHGNWTVVQRSADRGCHCQTSASHGYHQDQSPDRTCHVFSPMRVPWERKPLWQDYTRTVKSC